MRIVIVDSEETSREVIKQAINTVVETHKIKSGCKIVGEAADGRKGCEIIVKERRQWLRKAPIAPPCEKSGKENGRRMHRRKRGILPEESIGKFSPFSVFLVLLA